MITRIWTRLTRRRRRAEADTLTRLPAASTGTNTTTGGIAPVEPGADELAVRAALLRLLGVSRPR